MTGEQCGSSIVLPKVNDHTSVYPEMLTVYTLRSRKQYWWRRPEEGIGN